MTPFSQNPPALIGYEEGRSSEESPPRTGLVVSPVVPTSPRSSPLYSFSEDSWKNSYSGKFGNVPKTEMRLYFSVTCLNSTPSVSRTRYYTITVYKKVLPLNDSETRSSRTPFIKDGSILLLDHYLLGYKREEKEGVGSRQHIYVSCNNDNYINK